MSELTADLRGHAQLHRSRGLIAMAECLEQAAARIDALEAALKPFAGQYERVINLMETDSDQWPGTMMHYSRVAAELLRDEV